MIAAVRRKAIAAALAALALAVPGAGLAQMPAPARTTIPPPALPGTIALDCDCRPGAEEAWFVDNGAVNVRNVARPTLTPFLPRSGTATGAAMIVAPGGGFLGLAVEKEGWRIARWLADHGIAAFVLKYRVLPTPASQAEFADKMALVLKGQNPGFAPPDDTPAAAYADGIAALRYVRGHATALGIDPRRVGFMGFSAGGFLTRSLVERGGADRPAFAAPIYPNMASIAVAADSPPLFVVIGDQDFLLSRVTGFPLIEAYRAAGRPVEFHFLAGVGHGFGAGDRGTASEDWLVLLRRWLAAGGWLDAAHARHMGGGHAP